MSRAGSPGVDKRAAERSHRVELASAQGIQGDGVPCVDKGNAGSPYAGSPYEPGEDSFLLVRQVKEKARGKSVLDMGAGFGILAETAMAAGASSVLAADINEAHVRYCQAKGIPAIQSDLFSNIQGKFDLIVFNPPYLPEDELEDAETRQLVSGGKHGYEILARFLRDAKSHLNKQGEILFVFSSLTNKKKIDEILKKHKYKFELLEEEEHFYETLYVYSCH